MDIDECESNPCQNDSLCTESSIDELCYLIDTGARAPGFANGMCGYDYIADYDAMCSVADSTASSSMSGNCDVDANEYDSTCANDAACVESTVDPSVAYDAYQCLYQWLCKWYVRLRLHQSVRHRVHGL